MGTKTLWPTRNRSFLTTIFVLVLAFLGQVAAAYDRVEAENYAAASGVMLVSNGTAVGSNDNGDYLTYSFDFGAAGATSFSIRVAVPEEYAGQRIELRLDSLTGTLIGTINVRSTGGWDSFQDQSIPINRVTGSHSLYLVMRGTSGVANVDSFLFTTSPSAFNRVEAENYDAASGTMLVSNGSVVGSNDNGDYLTYALEFGTTGATHFSIRAAVPAEYAGQRIELRLDSVTGTLVGTVTVQSTGGWDRFQDQSIAVNRITGAHNLYLVMKGASGVADIDSFSFALSAPPAGGIPNPQTISGKPVVSQIIAQSGQIIENVHVTTARGSCIVADGVSNVIIRNSEIGPCGQSDDPNVPDDPSAQGVLIQNSSNVTIQRNVIHNVVTGVYAVVAQHPIIMDRNYVYNVRGPAPRGQMIQMNQVTGGSAPSRITCNISDAKPGIRFGVLHEDMDAGIEDHINLFRSPGLTSGRTEIAYNHLRGGHKSSTSGSGFVLGDLGGGYVNAHHNTVVDVVNVGAGIAGGSNISIDHNRIYQHRNNVNYVNLGLMVWGQAGAACGGNLTVRNNRVWTLNSNGVQNSYWNAGNCGTVDETGNVFADASLSPAIFDEPEAQCQ